MGNKKSTTRGQVRIAAADRFANRRDAPLSNQVEPLWVTDLEDAYKYLLASPISEQRADDYTNLAALSGYSAAERTSQTANLAELVRLQEGRVQSAANAIAERNRRQQEISVQDLAELNAAREAELAGRKVKIQERGQGLQQILGLGGLAHQSYSLKTQRGLGNRALDIKSFEQAGQFELQSRQLDQRGQILDYLLPSSAGRDTSASKAAAGGARRERRALSASIGNVKNYLLGRQTDSLNVARFRPPEGNESPSESLVNQLQDQGYDLTDAQRSRLFSDQQKTRQLSDALELVEGEPLDVESAQDYATLQQATG